MKKVEKSWILGGVVLAVVGAAALWPSRSPASERREALLAGGPFEGTITMVMDTTTLSKPATTTYEIKGSKTRFAMPAQGSVPSSVVVVDQAAAKSWLILEDRRTVLALDAGKAMSDMMAAAQVTPSFSVEKTGVMDTVAGLRCEKWEITSGSERISACVLEGLDISGGPVNGEASLSAEKAFPLRAIHTDANGVVTKHTEVRKIERRPIADDRFAVPADYSQADAIEIMKDMTAKDGAR